MTILMIILVNLAFMAIWVGAIFLAYKALQVKKRIAEKEYKLDQKIELYEQREQTFRKMDKPYMTHDEIFNMLHKMVQIEFAVNYGEHKMFEKVVIIRDYQGEVTRLTKNVLKGISKHSWTDFMYYYSAEYVYRIVSRQMKIQLAQFIKDHKMKVK